MLANNFYKGLQLLDTEYVGQQLLLTPFLSDYLSSSPDTMGLQAHVDPRALCIVIIICDELEERFPETIRDYLSKAERFYFDMLVTIERLCLCTLNASKSSIKLQFYIHRRCCFEECNTQEANSSNYVSDEFGYDACVYSSKVKLPRKSTSVNLNQPTTMDCAFKELSTFRDSTESYNFSLVSTASNNGSKYIRYDSESGSFSLVSTASNNGDVQECEKKFENSFTSLLNHLNARSFTPLLNHLNARKQKEEFPEDIFDRYDRIIDAKYRQEKANLDVDSIESPWYKFLLDHFEIKDLPENMFDCDGLIFDSEAVQEYANSYKKYNTTTLYNFINARIQNKKLPAGIFDCDGLVADSKDM